MLSLSHRFIVTGMFVGAFVLSCFAIGTASAADTADLSIVKSATGAIMRGRSLHYSVVITNLEGSGSDALHVLAKDLLPAGTTFNQQQSVGWTLSGAYAIRRLDALAKSMRDTTTLTIDIPSDFPCPTAIHNVVSVSSETVDLHLSNNQSELDTKVLCGGSGSGFTFADVSIIKTQSGSAFVSGPVTYWIKVTNHGPGVANTIRITDAYPRAFMFEPLLNPGWIQSGAFRLLRVLSSLQSNEQNLSPLRFRVLRTVRCNTVVKNKAGVTSATLDPNLRNNTAVVRTRISCR